MLIIGCCGVYQDYQAFGLWIADKEDLILILLAKVIAAFADMVILHSRQDRRDLVIQRNAAVEKLGSALRDAQSSGLLDELDRKKHGRQGKDQSYP